MSLGSPALVAYSLVLTALNARTVCRRARTIPDGRGNVVAGALVSLQQIPLELTEDEHLLDLIATGEGKWDQEIAGRLGPKNHWSIATASAMGWALLAFLFTVIDSFLSLIVDKEGVNEGHAVGTLWLWLFCLVTGWLWVPTFPCGEIGAVTSRANHKAAKRVGARSGDPTVDDTGGTIRFPVPETYRHPTATLPEENANAEIELAQDNSRPTGQEIERKSNLHPDPSHHSRPTMSPRSTMVGSQYSGISKRLTGLHSLSAPEGGLLLLKDDSPWLNANELRHSPTFNYSRVMRYLVLVDKVFGVLESTTVSLSRNRLILEVVSLILCRKGNERCCVASEGVPSRSVPLDVHSVVFRPSSPVWNGRRGYGDYRLYPYCRLEVPFFGIRSLWRDLYPHLVPHHHLNHLHPHRRNS